jgi:hypothetical protein
VGPGVGFLPDARKRFHPPRAPKTRCFRSSAFPSTAEVDRDVRAARKNDPVVTVPS